MAGPGHGAPGVLGPCYLEGSYSEVYPDCSEDEEGLLRLFKQFSFPGGIGSHCTPETPGLDPRGRRTRVRPVARLRGRVRQPGPDRRGRRRRRRVRDRAAGDELAHQQVPQPDPRRGGAADPAPERVQDQQPDDLGPGRRTRRSRRSSAGTGWTPYFVEGSDPETMHQAMAATIDKCVADIRAPRSRPGQRHAVPPAVADDRAPHPEGVDQPGARSAGTSSKGAGGRTRCRWPTSRRTRHRLKQLEDWMRGYKPEELFDDAGRLRSRS